MLVLVAIPPTVPPVLVRVYEKVGIFVGEGVIVGVRVTVGV